MKTSDFVAKTLQEKYTAPGERDAADVRARVAAELARRETDTGHWEAVFNEAQAAGVVMGGRICAAAGRDTQSTLMSSFVQPVGDSVCGATEGGRPAIMQALAEAATTMCFGGGVGYDFSSVRPRGALIRSSGSQASGAVAYMQLFDSMCETVRSVHGRRGAQMAMLRIDHPDILDFIHAKDKPGALANFNISIAVSDAFMSTLGNNGDFQLVHAARPHPQHRASAQQREDGLWVYDVVCARDLWESIMHSTYDHGEPGVVFVDKINSANNLFYCEHIEATNPCAEQPLPAYGCASLASIDLARFVREPFTKEASFDVPTFCKRVGVAVRMLDNVLDLTQWPLQAHAEQATAKRRVGLGFLGLGDALIMLGLRYDAQAGRDQAARISRYMAHAAYNASVDLAVERGSFAQFEARSYLQSEFVRRLPSGLRARIRNHGIRNSHLLSIAPTGTVSLALADNASSGVEPVFGFSHTRRVLNDSGNVAQHAIESRVYRRYRECGYDTSKLPAQFITALDISAADHLAMISAISPYIDGGISKTVNIPVDYPYVQFQHLYTDAWLRGVKSLATYRPNATTGSVLDVFAPVPPSRHVLAEQVA